MRNPPDLGINVPNPLNMSLGPSSVLRVRRSGPRFTLRGPRSRRPAAMQLAPGPTFNGRVLAGRSPAGLGKAPLAGPIRPKTRCMAGFSKRCVVSLIH
jgi:hypothetical protein